MAIINEVLRLTDHFSSTFHRYTQQAETATNSTEKLRNTVTRLAGAYLSLRGVSKFVNMSDSYAQTNARLNMVNESLGEQADLQTLIYEAAQRSRASYSSMSDIIAKLGTRAPDIWKNSNELIQFGENLTKMFGIAGATQGEIYSASLQLTQALGSGVLRGEELNAVFEAAPNVIQAIADYLDVDIGKIRSMASEGEITADIVKNAMLNATDEINDSFDSIPRTWAQTWTMATNALQKELQPAFQKMSGFINSDLGQEALGGLISAFTVLGNVASGAVDVMVNGAQFISDHWKTVQMVLYMAAAAAVVLTGAMVAAGISAVVAWAAATWPLLVVIGIIGMAIILARKFGITWEQIGSFIGGIFGTLFGTIINTFIVPIQNAFAGLVNFLYNAFQGKLEVIDVMFYDFSLGVIDYIRDIARAIENLLNSLPKVEVDITSYLDDVYNKQKQIRDNIIEKRNIETVIDRWDKVDVEEMKSAGAKLGGKFGKILDNFDPSETIEELASIMNSGTGIDLSQIDNNVAKTAENTGAIKKSVDMAKEDIKSLVDLSTRQYVNKINLTAQTPVITINGANTGSTAEDRKALANQIRDVILEQASAGASRTTARAF